MIAGDASVPVDRPNRGGRPNHTDCLDSIRRDGLRPHSFVARTRELASKYARLRAMTLGADQCVVIELDVTDAAVLEAQSWWWALDQLQRPFGCPPSCIVSTTTLTLLTMKPPGRTEVVDGS